MTFVNIGWNVGVHQFCRLGKHCMVSACSKLVQDVPPYMLADGFPAEVRSINKVGMERNGFSSEDLENVRAVFKTIYKSDFNRSQAMLALTDESVFRRVQLLRKLSNLFEVASDGVA